VATTTSAVRLDARLDAEPNRGLWLVKWLLLIPHLIVLFFLWIAFPVLSFVALVAILRDGAINLPEADRSLEAGDELLLVAAEEQEDEIGRLLAPIEHPS